MDASLALIKELGGRAASSPSEVIVPHILSHRERGTSFCSPCIIFGGHAFRLRVHPAGPRYQDAYTPGYISAYVESWGGSFVPEIGPFSFEIAVVNWRTNEKIVERGGLHLWTKREADRGFLELVKLTDLSVDNGGLRAEDDAVKFTFSVFD
jgi:hypothetical protein